jgi:gamma-glutamyltranspeptidase/glutathione hydrolase
VSALRFDVPEHRPYPFRRPAIQARQQLVVAGHWLAAEAGERILTAGGNAFDAGVAAGLALNVVLPQWTSLGGVAPIVAYRTESQALSTISGLGWWPRRASIAFFNERCGGSIPPGVLRSLVPGACDAWLAALQLYGTMSLGEVAGPAIDLAERGFSAYPMFVRWMGLLREQLLRWPSSAAVMLVDGQVPALGSLVRQPALAGTLRRLCRAEARGAGGNRARGIQAARDEFYRGEIAREMVHFFRDQDGLLEADDLADFAVEVGPPVTSRYGAYEIHGGGFWCQGPVLQQALNLLHGSGVDRLRLNSPEYVHLIAESLKLALADRHAYYGDPRFVDVPGDTLLSPAYAAERRRAIDPRRAWPGMPPAGVIPGYPRPRTRVALAGMASAGTVPQPGTSHLCVVDRWGNAMSATPSDGVYGAPLVPSLGFVVSARGGQSWLDPAHPAAVAGRKRPRLTPSPAIVTREGKPALAFGTSGTDAQTQVMARSSSTSSSMVWIPSRPSRCRGSRR